MVQFVGETSSLDQGRGSVLECPSLVKRLIASCPLVWLRGGFVLDYLCCVTHLITWAGSILNGNTIKNWRSR